MHHLPCPSALATLTLAAAILLALAIVAAQSREYGADSSSTFFPNRDISPPPDGVARPHFPESQIVLDMAILSRAVYKLKNRATSCNDVRWDGDGKIVVDDPLREGAGHVGDGYHPDDIEAEETRDLHKLVLPEGTECLHYSHDHSLGTQVLIVRSYLHKYVAVAYAGTDDWRTALMDGNILMSDIGPANNTSGSGDVGSLFIDLPDGIRVHHGFNEAVFDSENFHEVLNCVKSARMGGECGDEISIDSGGFNMETKIISSVAPYQLFTTGHSLGAADSVLLGATLHLMYPNDDIRSINFGCPKIGNIKWAFWINSLQPDKKTGNSSSGGSFEVFRFVNKIDLVPRLPELGVSLDPMLTHTGHTIQMSPGGFVRVSRN
jgi:hypothetical protein